MNVTSSFSMSSLGSMSGSGAPPPGPPPGPPPTDAPRETSDILTALDADESGGLSLDEVSNSLLSKFITEDNWSDVDVDGDGALSVSELESHRETVAPPGGGNGPLSASSSSTRGADIEALFESLTSTDEDSTDSSTQIDSLLAQAENLYTSMQSLFAV